MFVLSAGFAREYDNEDLLHEPWYLLLPLLASLVASLLLFSVLYGSAFRSQSGPSLLMAYRAFLGLFWFTAPLAWQYAFPYERLLDPVGAAQANLGTLALVSAWRVALMVRVAVVLMGLTTWAALPRVLGYASGVAFIALFFVPFPIIEVMGGVHVAKEDVVVRSAAQLVGCFGVPLFAACLILTLSIQARPRWQIQNDAQASAAISRPLQVLAVLSVAIWIGILPLTQPEQQLRWHVEDAFREGRLSDGLALMLAHAPDEFPPHWEPPPRYLKGEDSALVLDVWDEILKKEPAPWVREHYLARIKHHLAAGRHDEQRIAELINRLPEGPTVLRDLATEPRLRWYLERLDPHLRRDLRMREKPGE